MRAIFVGAGSMSLRTAKTMVERGHEVVIIEPAPEIISRVQEELDCGCLQGDGTRPRVLREADPSHVDVLFCLTGNDQTNLIASLVGRSLGIERVITRINDEEFEHVCLELGLQDLVLPTRTIGRYLASMAEGHEVLDLSAAIRGRPASSCSWRARRSRAWPSSAWICPGARASRWSIGTTSSSRPTRPSSSIAGTRSSSSRRGATSRSCGSGGAAPSGPSRPSSTQRAPRRPTSPARIRLPAGPASAGP